MRVLPVIVACLYVAERCGCWWLGSLVSQYGEEDLSEVAGEALKVSLALLVWMGG